MSADNKVPAIRFEGFGGEWEESPLGDIICYIKGFAFKSGDYKKAGTRIIRASDLTSDSIAESAVKIYISNSKAKQYSKYIIKLGDIVITTVGSKAELRDSAVGRAIIFNKNEGHLLNQNLVKITPVNQNDSQFIYNQLLREKYANYIEDIQRGNANQANIAISDLWNYTLKFPRAAAEQTQIGNTFQKLDSLISQHQQKHDKLLNLKKALLEKMFPKQGATEPEIRFKGFSGGWEEKALGVLTQVVDPHPSHRAPDAVPQGVPFIGIGDISENGAVDYSSVRIVSDRIYKEHSRRYTLNEGDFAYGRVASIGKIIDLSKNVLKKYTYSPTMALVKRININSDYLKAYLHTETFKNCVDNKTTGSTRKSLGVESFRNLAVIFPDKKEQTKIGNLFKQLDTLISQHQAQLKKLGNIKQACLEKMFV